ncbi:MAG: amino acid adenylation domain-containing protein [Chromatiales bacterium]|nr:amino acid adenylation domain-containing protein [Pseudomonadota bacterium]MBT6276940.1 amino acid adenylation domain-containing protein [Chromatiales bacterium]
MVSNFPQSGPERHQGQGLFLFDKDTLAARDFWRGALTRDIGSSTVPADRCNRDASDARTGSSLSSITGATWSKVKVLTQSKPSLVNLVVLAAVASVLHRITGSGVVVLGSPPRGEDLEPNALPLVMDLSEGQTFRELLVHIKGVAQKAYRHQQYPHTSIVRDLGLSEEAGRYPLFDVSVRCTGLHGPLPSTTEDIAILMSPTEEALGLEITYKPALFDESTIERFKWRLGEALSAGVINPDVRLADLDLLTSTEKSQVLTKWMQAPELLDDTLLHTAFRLRATETPEATAVECAGERLTYRELDARSDQLAMRLRRLDVGPERVVGLCLQPSIARVVSVLAVLKAGGAFLPLDPENPGARLQYMLGQAGPRVVIADPTGHARLGDLSCPSLEPDSSAKTADTAQVDLTDHVESVPDNLAYIIYTSGSTGNPKGVACHHRGLANLAAAQIRAFNVNASSRVLQFASFGFDASVSEMAMTLAAGATLVLGSRDELFPGDNLHQFLKRERITHVTLVPSVLELLPDAPLPGLSTLVVAGEACPASLVERWSAGRTFLNAYGPTEVTVCATIGRCHPGGDRGDPSIGRPMANMETFVLDTGMRPVVPGSEGELWLGGLGVARGYLGNGSATAERFVPHPFGTVPGARLYRTGDRARFRPDGQIEFLGRTDTQVKVRGHRIELTEIEAVLRRYPMVGDVAVVIREDTPGHIRLVAYVEVSEPKMVDVGGMQEHLRAHLPYYMQPELFDVSLKLPRTAKGSIARNALRPPVVATIEHALTVQPRDAIETEVVAVWEILLEREGIGVRSNFFDLGGHSFLAVRLLAEVRERFSVDLPLTAVLNQPTVENMARMIREQGTSLPEWSPLVTMRGEGVFPPLYCVHPAGGSISCYGDLVNALGPEYPVYALQASGLLEGQTPIDTIEAMASAYVSAIQVGQPAGPYHLCGWSAGGLIAYEMAQQLRARGHTVALVALVDTYAPSALKMTADLVADEVVQVLSLFGDSLSLTEEDLLRQDPERRLEYVVSRARAASLVPEGYGVEDARRLLRVFGAIGAACEAYHPVSYAGSVLMFAAQEDIAGAVLDPNDSEHGWQSLVTHSLRVVSLEGTHFDLLREPLVARVADVLREEIGAVAETR